MLDYNYYKVSAVNNQGESQQSNYIGCNYAGGGGGKEYAPCNPSVSVNGTTSQTVSWAPSTGYGCGTPTSYEVYKQNPFTSEWELKKTTTSKSYSSPSSDIHPGINRYTVKAINSSGSAYMVAYSQEVPLAKPSSFTAQKSGSNVIFTWSKVTWATGYQIFICSSAYGNYTIFTQVADGGQTTLTYYYPVSSGTTCYFKIRAIHESSLVLFEYSDMTTYKSVKF